MIGRLVALSILATECLAAPRFPYRVHSSGALQADLSESATHDDAYLCCFALDRHSCRAEALAIDREMVAGDETVRVRPTARSERPLLVARATRLGQDQTVTCDLPNASYYVNQTADADPTTYFNLVASTPSRVENVFPDTIMSIRWDGRGWFGLGTVDADLFDYVFARAVFPNVDVRDLRVSIVTMGVVVAFTMAFATWIALRRQMKARRARNIEMLPVST